jgi:hypothetical protein
MTARNKLNAAHLNSVFLVAGLLGWVTESANVFLLAAAALLLTGWQSGGLRGGR